MEPFDVVTMFPWVLHLTEEKTMANVVLFSAGETMAKFVLLMAVGFIANCIWIPAVRRQPSMQPCGCTDNQRRTTRILGISDLSRKSKFMSSPIERDAKPLAACTIGR